MSRGWGFAIDYDAEIANDLAEIAAVERHVPLVDKLTLKERLWVKQYGHLSVESFLFGFGKLEERAALLGLSLDEAYDLAQLRDIVLLEVPDRVGSWYSRAEQISKRLEEQFGADIVLEPRAVLMKLRARLARHRRNKRKFHG